VAYRKEKAANIPLLQKNQQVESALKTTQKSTKPQLIQIREDGLTWGSSQAGIAQ